jgi:hypothetical protein
MNIVKVKSFAFVALLCLASWENAHAISLPGIPPAGAPNFTNDVKVNLFNLAPGSYLLAATNAGAPITFNHNGSFSSTASNPATFLLTAQFSGNGNYVPNTGNLSITGSIPFPNPSVPGASVPGVFVTGDLLTARLTGFAFDGDNLGFSTNMISGYGALFNAGTAESVYLTASGLAGALGFGSPSLIAATGLPAFATTTVPVPAAAWLLGSALVGMVGIGSRNRRAANLA